MKSRRDAYIDLSECTRSRGFVKARCRDACISGDDRNSLVLNKRVAQIGQRVRLSAYGRIPLAMNGKKKKMEIRKAECVSGDRSGDEMENTARIESGDCAI